MPQSTYSPIVTRAKAQMETIADIGKVSDRLRLLTAPASIETYAVTEIAGVRTFRAWFLDLKGMTAKPAEAGGSMQWDRVLSIEGFFQFQDATGSEQLAIEFAEKVIRVLWNDCRTTRLNGTVLFGKPASIVDDEPKKFAGVTCSYVRLEMPLTTIESVAP